MKRILYFTACMAAALSAVACEDFFERIPENEFDANTFFRTENDLVLYSNGLIDAGLPGVTSTTMGKDLYTDLCATNQSHSDYTGGLSQDNASGWAYGEFGFLRQIAYMLEYMPNAKENVEPEIYNHYEGVARFWRAYATFNKVKAYGDCYFIDHVISSSESLLREPRQDREYVVHKIVEDLDFAAKHCLEEGFGIHTEGRIYINRYVVLAMASRICLYEGTFRKYHDVNPSTGKAWKNEYESSDELLRKARDYSRDLIEENKFSLHEDFREIFTSNNLVTDEVIWGRTCSENLGKVHSTTREFCNEKQKYSPTKDYVRMFLNTDGTYSKPDRSGEEEFERRDARLAATVLGPKEMKVNGNRFTPNFIWSVTGYNWLKWTLADDNAIKNANRSTNSIPVLRYAEVLLNHAEAVAELDEMTPDIWQETVGKIRETHGKIRSIYPGDGEFNEDPYLRYYYTVELKHATELSSIILEIRRERATELMLEGDSRYDDLMRWRLGDLIARRSNGKAWRGIYIPEGSSSFSFNGTEYSVSKDVKATTSNTFLYLEDEADFNWSLSEGDHGYLLYNLNITWEDKMYLRPISLKAIDINPDLGQNEGWQWM